MGASWGDGGSDLHTIHTFVRKARANKGKSLRRLHSEGSLLDKMRLKDSLFEGQAGSKMDRKKDKKLKKLSLGAGGSSAGSNGGEKRARIKRSKNPKLPKSLKKLKSSPRSETDSETGPSQREERSAAVELAGQCVPPQGAELTERLKEESTREAEMSSSEGETWIADEDIMVESGEWSSHWWWNAVFLAMKVLKILQ